MTTPLLDVRLRWATLCLELACRRGRGEPDAKIEEVELCVAMLEEQWLFAEPPSCLAGFALTPTEQRVINLLAAIATDLDAQRFCASLGGTNDPTLAVIRHVVYAHTGKTGFVELSPEGRLRRLRLIERTDNSPTTHESRQTWVLSRRVCDALHGVDSFAPELQNIARVGLPNAGVLVCSEEVTRRTREAACTSDALIVVAGSRGMGRRLIASAAASAAGKELLEVQAERLSKDPSVYREQLKAIARECTLLGRLPIICNVDALADGQDETRLQMLGDDLSTEIDGPLFVTANATRPPVRWGRATIVIEVKPPTSDQRAKLWLSELGQGTPEDAEFLATQYPLAPALIHHAAKAAKARANGRPMEPEDIYAGVRAVLDDKLGDYAKRVEVTQTWDDLVLPNDQMEAVDYLIARIRQRRTVYEQWGFAAKVGKGLGTSALFSGPPGTGKTMVAALIAKELGLELYQVDMAKVVSKFIGETERNLAALFDAAEAGHAILLFDEADSLFGKRTEVKSSNDRYANLETNYLLQRLESFTGICLLTSNHESNIDPAFQRRLSLHLRFELPEAEERAALWRAMLPPAAPVASNIDVMSLARRFVMSGGYIRNAALRAAFLAADEGSEITAMHLERAARLEYEGMGKIAA